MKKLLALWIDSKMPTRIVIILVLGGIIITSIATGRVSELMIILGVL